MNRKIGRLVIVLSLSTILHASSDVDSFMDKIKKEEIESIYTKFNNERKLHSGFRISSKFRHISPLKPSVFKQKFRLHSPENQNARKGRK
jgi:hypothetical protein